MMQGVHFVPWSTAASEMLKDLVAEGLSASQIVGVLNKSFPDEKPKTRNAVIGRMDRQGLKMLRPIRYCGQPKPQRTNATHWSAGAIASLVEGLKSGKPFPILAGEINALYGMRYEARQLRAKAIKLGVYKPHTRSAFNPSIRSAKPKEEQRGPINIIEAHPDTSTPMLEVGFEDCKWPTSDNPRDMEVCGQPATCGAYCDRHAQLAYRKMPEGKRIYNFNRREEFYGH